MSGSRPTITGRSTSIAAAFVQAIIPRGTVDKDQQLAVFARLGIDPLECVYCGADASDQDHFRAIVRGSRPSGYFHTIENLVPSCGRCNQSKGGQSWRTWMTGPAKNSPTTRRIADLQVRIDRLERFEHEWGATNAWTDADFRRAVGDEDWQAYWRRFDALVAMMKEAQRAAETLRERLGEAFKTHTAGR